MWFKIRRVTLSVLAGGLLLAGTSAQAGFSNTVVNIQATNAQGTADYTLLLNEAANEQDLAALRLSWGLANSIDLVDEDGDMIAKLTDLNLFLDGDPVVNLNFAVQAGMADTTFTISSAVVAFPAINNPLATASAAVTVTDGSGTLPGDGGSISTVAPNSTLYRATYNGSTNFAELLGNLSVPGGQLSDSINATEPVAVIPGAVTSIQSDFKFKLSAKDQASGTSTFVVQIPEPGTLAMIAVTGVLALRRRRA